MNLLLERQPSYKAATFGSLSIDGQWFCHTLEDMIREVPGVAVEKWKVHGGTAIPAGRYRITLENNPTFGPDTITINAVRGFAGVRMHGVKTVDTEGCPRVGSHCDREACTISEVRLDQVLAGLKGIIASANEEVWIDIVNPATNNERGTA